MCLSSSVFPSHRLICCYSQYCIFFLHRLQISDARRASNLHPRGKNETRGIQNAYHPPQIVTTICPTTNMVLEPYEEVNFDVDVEYSGTVVNALTGSRKGVVVEMSNDAQGKTRMKFLVPSRGLLGSCPEIAMATRCMVVMHHCYLED